MNRPLLFQMLPGLRNSIEWAPLGEYPTPVEKMAGLCMEENIKEFYIKRDDLSSPFYGGNKVRKLEFLLADAKAHGNRVLLTFGAVGSNHVLAAVIHGERLGIRTVAVMFPQPNALYVRRNLLLDCAHGAMFAVASSMATAPASFARGMLSGYKVNGFKLPYVIPPGGTNRLGCLGYIEAALELKEQIDAGLAPEPEYIFITLGSGGTAAGLIIGARMAGLKSRVVPVRVVEKIACNRHLLAFHINRTQNFVRGRCTGEFLPRINPGEITIIDDFAGEHYAQFTPECIEAVSKAKRLDGIKLEGTYTGKTLAGALDFIHKHDLEKKPCLFWNTYNSADIYTEDMNIDYHELPLKLHTYFETPVQEEKMSCDVV